MLGGEADRGAVPLGVGDRNGRESQTRWETLQQVRTIRQGPTGKGALHPPPATGHPCNSASQKLPSAQCLPFSSRLLFRTAPTSSLHLLHNIVFPSSVALACGFAVACLSRFTIFLLFPNKSILWW